MLSFILYNYDNFRQYNITTIKHKISLKFFLQIYLTQTNLLTHLSVLYQKSSDDFLWLMSSTRLC